MWNAIYALLAILPWVAFTLMLRFLIHMEGWPIGLVGVFSRIVTVSLLLVWIATTGSGLRRLRPRGMGLWLLLMGAIAIFVHVLWFASVRWTTATSVAMLFRLDVLFVVILGWSLGLERIGRAQLLLLPGMFVGLGLLTEIRDFDWHGHLIGDLMIVVASFGLAANAFVIRHILSTMDCESVAVYNHGINSLGFVVLGTIEGAWSRVPDVAADPTVWRSLLVMGVLAAVGLPLYYVALRRMSVWKLRMFMLSAPVFTVAVEWPLWGVPLTSLQCLGGIIILIGLAILIRLEVRETSAPAESTAVPNSEQ